MRPYPLPFKNRQDAGRKLAAALHHMKNAAPVVLALPRGGVPVAYEVARELEAPLDVLLVRKIGAPGHPELGLGAVVDGESPQVVLNDSLVARIRPPEGYIDAETTRQVTEIERRRQVYCGTRPPIPLQGRNVIVVDDGVATGGTLKTALKALSKAGAQHVTFAVPVAPRDVLDSLFNDADDGVCLASPDPFMAVSLYYEDFAQTSDEEVVGLLKAAERETGRGQRSISNADRPVSEVMEQDVPAVSPHDDIAHAAGLIDNWNIDALPVCEGNRLSGVLSSQDIAVNAKRAGEGMRRVSDIMSDEVIWCFADQTVGDVVHKMGDSRLRKIPVVDRDIQLVGMVDLDDLAALCTPQRPATEELGVGSELNALPPDASRNARPPDSSLPK